MKTSLFRTMGRALLVAAAVGAAAEACSSGSAVSGVGVGPGVALPPGTDVGVGVTVGVGAGSGVGGAGGMAPVDVCPTGSVSVCSSAVPSCGASDSLCLASGDVKSGGSQFGLRVVQLDIARPVALRSGAKPLIPATAVAPNDAACGLMGEGTLSWLLRFDTQARTLTTGGAAPVADASQPYAFLNQAVTSGSTTFHVGPVTLDGAPTATCRFESTSGDVVLPYFADFATDPSASPLLLPLHGLNFHDGVVSADQACIGRFNGDALQVNNCEPDAQHPLFQDGASVDAFFILEEADTVELPALGQSLCVLLSGDPMGYGDGATPIAHCKLDPMGRVLFNGDWCAATDKAATPACADALHFSASFAARAATIQ